MGSNREKFNIENFDRLSKIISNLEGTNNIFTDCSRNFSHQTNYVHTLDSNSQNVAMINRIGFFMKLNTYILLVKEQMKEQRENLQVQFLF